VNQYDKFNFNFKNDNKTLPFKNNNSFVTDNINSNQRYFNNTNMMNNASSFFNPNDGLSFNISIKPVVNNAKNI